MRIIILILNVFTLFSCNNNVDKKYFKVVESDKSIFENEKSLSIRYKINMKDEQTLLIYPINVSNYSDEEKLEMIKELLSFADDHRICVNPISNYNPRISQIYRGEVKKYSIQLEALFLINQIFFDAPFDYSPIPILVDRKTKQEQSIKGDIVSTAFSDYKKWLKDISEIGFEKAKKEKIYPLSNSKASWLYSIGN